MQRLIYDSTSRRIIAIIDPCEGTVTGTPYLMFEGTEEEVQARIEELGLEVPPDPAASSESRPTVAIDG